MSYSADTKEEKEKGLLKELTLMMGLDHSNVACCIGATQETTVFNMFIEWTAGMGNALCVYVCVFREVKTLLGTSVRQLGHKGRNASHSLVLYWWGAPSFGWLYFNGQ